MEWISEYWGWIVLAWMIWTFGFVVGAGWKGLCEKNQEIDEGIENESIQRTEGPS